MGDLRGSPRRPAWAAGAIAAVVIAILVVLGVDSGGDEPPPAASTTPAQPAPGTARPQARAEPGPTPAGGAAGRGPEAELEQRAREHVDAYRSEFNRRFRVGDAVCDARPERRFECAVPLVHEWGAYNLTLRFDVRATPAGGWEVLRRRQT